MRLWPFAWLGKPTATPAALKRAAWADLVPRYHITCPADNRKQWRTVQVTKRKQELHVHNPRALNVYVKTYGVDGGQTFECPPGESRHEIRKQ